MTYRGTIALLGLVGLAAGLRADPATDALVKEIQAVKKEGPSSPEARAAWARLVARGPAQLPAILQALDTQDTVLANWLRTAFDRIVDVEMKAGGKAIDVEAVLAFVNDGKRQGRARRLALDVVENLRPGTRDKLVAGWLEDPEFRFDAVANLIADAEKQAKDGKKDEARTAYRKAWAATRDVGQAQTLRTRLQELGDTVSVAEHMGFLSDWYVIGPFDGKSWKGFKTTYPPEEKIDLAGELPGREGPVKWKRYTVKEATSGLPARVVLVNLPEALGTADDAVGYAYTAFTVGKAEEVEFRGAADDNFAVWVNGKRLFGFEEYRNGVRLDRHRFKANLQLGVNQVLVKVVQAPHDESNPAPNWEFLLRVVDATGKGIGFKNMLPTEK